MGRGNLQNPDAHWTMNAGFSPPIQGYRRFSFPPICGSLNLRENIDGSSRGRRAEVVMALNSRAVGVERNHVQDLACV